jgi:site-specific recombinase XerD
VRTFSKWLAENGWVETDPLAGLKIPQPKKIRFDLVEDDLRAKLFALFEPNTFLGARALAMLAILSDTGVRREECVNIQIKDVDLTGHVIRVLSDKTTEWRYVPLSDEAVMYLHNYLKWRERFFKGTARYQAIPGDDNHRVRKQRVADANALFVTWRGRPMDPQELSHVFHRASAKLGVRLHPHLFRHDWITRKALDGENPSMVKRWAGHSQFSMTDYYFDLAEEMLGAIKPKHSTLANIPLPGQKKRGRPKKATA